MGAKRRIAGSALIGLGGLVLMAVLGYSAYAWYATSNLDSLNTSNRDSLDTLFLPTATPAPGALPTSSALPPTQTVPASSPTSTTGAATSGSTPTATVATPTATMVANPFAVDLSTFQGVYPSMWPDLPTAMASMPASVRLQVPAIGLDATVVTLDTTYVGPRLVYDMEKLPAETVGHAVGTYNPGEIGNMVLVGHITSPITRKGSVFINLPQVIDIYQSGPVDIIVTTSEARWLYRVVETQVEKPEDVDLFRPTNEPGLTLLTCIPPGVYSHRLLVNAVLIGKAPLE